MSEISALLFALLILLTLITVIGHGIWVLLAAIFRSFVGESRELVDLSSNCDACGSSVRSKDNFCTFCGRGQGNTTLLADLVTTARQIDRLLNAGKIDPATYKLVSQAIEEERARLDGRRRQEPIEEPIQPPPVFAEQSQILDRTQQTIPPVLASTVEENIIPGSVVAEDAVTELSPAPVISRVEAIIQSEAGEGEVIGSYSSDSIQAQPRRSFSEMLATFMEESSIRWGEIIGGLLIIGGSIALVISLWSQITTVPLLKFSAFIGVTAGLFGLGFYSAHRWKLPTTSRGALIISTLLVPLNFLAMTAFSHTASPSSPIVIGGELLALGLFLFLVYEASHVIVPGCAWMLLTAVLGPSFAMLLARHWVSITAVPPDWLLLGIAPLICYWISIGGALRRLKKEDRAGESAANSVFVLLGLASFAALLPLGLLIFKSGASAAALRQFAPLFSPLGVPAIASGLAILRQENKEQSGELLTAATSLGFLGAGISLAALVIAWPNPLAVLAVAFINLAIYAVAAWRFDLKIAHIAAILHLLLVHLIACNLLAGNITWWQESGQPLIASLFSVTSGAALILAFILLLGVAESYTRAKMETDARIYTLAAIATGVASLALVSLHGFGRINDPHHAGLIYAFYAAAAFLIAWRRKEAIAGWLGSVLALLAIVQVLAFKFGNALSPYHPLRLSLLVYAGMATIAAMLLHSRGERARQLFASPLMKLSLICSLAVTPFVLFGGRLTMAQISLRMLWLGAIWLAIAFVYRWPWLFAFFQVALTISVVCGVAAVTEERLPLSSPAFIHPVMLQAQGVALALLSLAWIILRLSLRKFGVTSEINRAEQPETTRAGEIFTSGVASRLLYPPWPSVDRIVTGFAVFLLAALCTYGAFELMAEELITGKALSSGIRGFATKALGAGSWLLVVALVITLTAGLWERFEQRNVLAILVVSSLACLLVAGRWQVDGATASAYRWVTAFGFALVSLPILFRRRVSEWSEKFGWPEMKGRSVGLGRRARVLTLALFAAPAIICTLLTFAAYAGGFGATPPGNSFFAAIGVDPSLVIPLIIISLSFVAHAVRERSPNYACSAGLILNLAVTLCCLTGESKLTVALLTRLVQFNIITTSAFSLVWLTVLRLRARNEAARDGEQAQMGVLTTQVEIALYSSLALPAVGALRLFIAPSAPSELALSIGTLWGWAAIILAGAAFVSLRRLRFDRLRPEHLGAGLMAVGSLISCTLSRFDHGNWLAYHALMLSFAIISWTMIALHWRALNKGGYQAGEVPDELQSRFPDLFSTLYYIGKERTTVSWAAAAGILAILMTLRGMQATGEPWWTVVTSLTMSLLFVVIAILTRGRDFLYIAALLCNLTATRLLLALSPKLGVPSGLLLVNIIALALPALIWLRLELKVFRTTRPESQTKKSFPVHHAAALISLGLIACMVPIQWWFEFSFTDYLIQHAWIELVALASVAALMIGCLWDDEARFSLPGIYLIGLLIIGWAIIAMNPKGEILVLVSAMALAFYALAASVLWRKRETLIKLADKVRIPRSDDRAKPIHLWLIVANWIVTLAVFLLTIPAVFGFDSLWQRLAISSSAFLIPLSFAFLAQDWRKEHLIKASIRLFILSAVVWGWAWLEPVAGRQLINCLVIVMTVALAAVIAYRLWIVKQVVTESAWRGAFRAELPWITVAGLSVLAVLLSIELSNYFAHGDALMTWPVVIVMMVTLIALVLATLAFALLPGEDPFDFSERGEEHKKMRYVYACEALIALALIHARATMPWLFGGLFERYWPLVVMALAFLGVGLSEFFSRKGRLVLAEPLARTGIMLPLLPVIGFWVADSQVSYSGLLFLVGLFYGVLSVMRQSFLFGLFAALAANGGLWHFLNGVEGYGFFQHPQLWLIPAALSVLLAARINRDRLSHDQMTTIRYATLMSIYVSSTADIFINGVYESPWLPIILALLSVSGVIAGLMLRVRSFLFLGTAFLLLAVFTMIWSASVNLHWRWLWYLTAIAFGVLIFYTFAMLDKKRSEMLSLVDRLKQWQA